MELDSELKGLILATINEDGFSWLDLLSEVSEETGDSETFYRVCDLLGIE